MLRENETFMISQLSIFCQQLYYFTAVKSHMYSGSNEIPSKCQKSRLGGFHPSVLAPLFHPHPFFGVFQAALFGSKTVITNERDYPYNFCEPNVQEFRLK